MPVPVLMWLVPAAFATAIVTRKRRFLSNPVKGSYVPTTGNTSFMARRSDSHFHRGIDIGAPMGTPVHAAAPGVVLHAVKNPGTPGFRGYGKVVVIKHPKNYYTLYSHLSEVSVNPWDVVTPNDVIGRVGDSCDTAEDPNNRCSNTHLHFELSRRPYPQAAEAPRLDPTSYMQKQGGRYV